MNLPEIVEVKNSDGNYMPSPPNFYDAYFTLDQLDPSK